MTSRGKLPQPDSPEDILKQLCEDYVIWSKYGLEDDTDETDLITEALTKLDEYYTNKFLEIVGEDEFVDSLEGYNVPSWDDMRKQAASLGKNQLKAELRQAIKQLSKRGKDNE